MFIYAAGAESPLKAPCVDILRRGRLADGVSLGRDVARLFPGLLSITRDDILKAGDLLTARPQLSPRDALHAATALNNGIAVIVSTDTNLDHVDGLTRLDPAAV